MDYVLTDKAARGLARILRGNRGNTGGGGTAYGVISPDDYALPFAVRWSATEGGWVIWLPAVASLCMVDDSYVTITGVSAAQHLPAGWYTVSGASSSATAFYLEVTRTEASGSTPASDSATITDSPSGSSTGSTVYDLLIAQVATDATTGAKTVKQFLASAVTIGGKGGGAYWETGGDSTTCNGTEIKVGNVLIYEVTL